MTIEEKYKWILSKLEVSDVDLWEHDALLRLKEYIYFQFGEAPESVDAAIELAMQEEHL